jgi:uncharacterized protein
MIKRLIEKDIDSSLRHFPVVGLVGPRQSGKTTLARLLAEKHPGNALFLDLERPSDLAKLDDPEFYLKQNTDKLVVFDEVQRKPDLFPRLRSLVDEKRKSGRFLVLGSASPDLMKQSAESLAGRIVYHKLLPFIIPEVGISQENAKRLWTRGGYPLSFLAKTDAESMNWRQAFISTYLERDIPQLGIRVPAAMLRRFWQMLAHMHGQQWNASRIAASLGVSPPTAHHYLDVLQDTFMVLRLQPYFANIKKRLVKTPKVYIRDSGILHSILNVNSNDDLINNPIAGSSFEGWVIEQVITSMPKAWEPYFYRSSGGAEIDLVLVPPGKKPIAIEIKLSLSPTVSKGFWEAFKDLQCESGFVIYSGNEYYPIRQGVYALPVGEIEKIHKE